MAPNKRMISGSRYILFSWGNFYITCLTLTHGIDILRVLIAPVSGV